MKKKMAWESWNAKEHELIENSETQTADLEIDEDDMDNIQGMMPIMISSDRSISTPFGKYDPSSPFTPSERWDCWICHTNFNITQDISDLINEAFGVEALVIMGRYTFCIGVAKMFEANDVKSNIESILIYNNKSNTLAATKEMTDITNKINEIKKSPHWAILVKNDGKIKFVASEEHNEEYIKKINNLEKLKEKNGGEIFYSGKEKLQN